MINAAHWFWPQWTMAGLLVFSLARGLFKHGESDGTVSFWASLLSGAISLGLLIPGGFFK